MSAKKKVYRAIQSVSICVLFMIVSCAVNPVTGRRELSLISEQGEISLGKETDVDIRSQYGVYKDASLNTYIQNVGQSMVPHTHRPHLTYHFVILDSPVVNAFAVPGGYIYVTRGILALMNSEAELAVVLGHELGHVNARHSVRKLSQLMLVQLGLTVGGALSETFAKISGVASIGVQLLFLKFSRDDERQADALGVEYSRKGGYNPREMVSFFISLEKLGDLSAGHSLPGFLSTHPLTNERIQNTRAMLTDADQKLTVGQNPYLNAIASLVYGKDPRQGYVEKNIFYHPQLRFSFTFPKEWTLQNTPTKVVLASNDGRAAMVLQAEKTSENLKDYAAKKASQIEGKQFIHEQRLTINGWAAYRGDYHIIQKEQEDLRIRLYCIKKKGYIFTFSALSTQADFVKYDGSFHSISGSFKELKDSRYLNREPKRIKVIMADGTKNLRHMFQESRMEKDLYQSFAIMNGMKLDQVPQHGQPIKIIK